MSKTLDITFTNKPKPSGGLVIVLVGTDVTLARGAESVDPKKTLPRAAGIAGFSGKPMTKLDVVAPEGSPADRILLVGLGKADAVDPNDWMRAGGVAAGELRRAESATVYLDVPGCEAGVEEAVGFAAGMVMRAYSFDTYKTMRGNGDEAETGPAKVKVRIAVSEPAKAKKAFDGVRGVLDGVALARDLVNEPANILGPIEFAARAKALERLGVDVEILTEKEMKKLGMGALLGVAQGSARPPRLAIMQWKGGKAKDKPVAFIGKGVVFDTGGISIKPAGGMESMKGDMGGAAAVTGLMHALAARKARVNAVGIIGIVENMPDGKAQRPGDIVTTMSGQTVEVINTDAEGRLVLADALWYCQNRFKPQCMINLATLTGAVIVALGHHHAGLFSNNDELSARLTEAGVASSEKLWRLPLGPDYDKLLESKFADMKNVGGRPAGSIIAAQFLQRFVNGTPWAHLDIAGTAMSAPQTEVNRSWASGFGVRLLNTFVEAHYER